MGFGSKHKKNVFANSSTGYGRKHNYNNNNNNNKSYSKNNEKEEKVAKDEKSKTDLVVANDKELNTGFGDYLRSPEAVEMMKLFVFANTIMLIVTMAWPNLKEQYYWIRHWWYDSVLSEYAE